MSRIHIFLSKHCFSMYLRALFLRTPSSHSRDSLLFSQGSRLIALSGVTPKSWSFEIQPVPHLKTIIPDPRVVSLHTGCAKPIFPRLILWMPPASMLLPNLKLAYTYMKGIWIKRITIISNMSQKWTLIKARTPNPSDMRFLFCSVFSAAERCKWDSDLGMFSGKISSCSVATWATSPGADLLDLPLQH